MNLFNSLTRAELISDLIDLFGYAASDFEGDDYMNKNEIWHYLTSEQRDAVDAYEAQS